MEGQVLGQVGALGSAMADVAVQRERSRRMRLRRVATVLAMVAAWLLIRALLGNLVVLGPPHIPAGLETYIPAFLLVGLLGVAILVPMLGGGPFAARRSTARARSTSSLDDVKGAGVVVDEVVKTLNLFLAYKTFQRADGRHAASGHPLRGPARHRQDLHGQGHGARGGRAVPVRVVVGVPVDVLRPDQPQDPLLLQGRCARRPARRAAPSGSSRRSTPSARPARAWGRRPDARASPAW